MTKQRIDLVTAVWGKWHVDVFLNVNLPTMLAPENLPHLSQAHEVRYIILTRPKDIAIIKSSSSFAILSQIMPVEIRNLNENTLSDPIAAHHAAWADAIELAKSDHATVVLISPDLAWSENCFRNLGEKIAHGAKAVFLNFFRVESDLFLDEFPNFTKNADNSVSVSARDLLTTSMKTMHPLMAACSPNPSHFVKHIDMVVWPVADEGLLLRVLARELFAFDANAIELGEKAYVQNLCDLQFLSFVADSDDMFAVSLAPLGKDVGWYSHSGGQVMHDVGSWWLDNDSVTSDFVASHTVRWHLRDIDPHKWKNAERRSNLFVSRATSTREGFRLAEFARTSGCLTASRFLEYATTGGLLSRAIAPSGPAIVLLPTDLGLQHQKNEAVTPSSDTPTSLPLSQVIRAHYAPMDKTLWSEKNPLEQIVSRGELKTILGPVSAKKDGTDFVVNDVVVKNMPTKVGHNIVYPTQGSLV